MKLTALTAVIFCFSIFNAISQTPPTNLPAARTISVTVSNDGTLLAPTNFFSKNSNALNQSVTSASSYQTGSANLTNWSGVSTNAFVRTNDNRAVTLTNPANVFAGNGNALTNLAATNLTGIVPIASGGTGVATSSGVRSVAGGTQSQNNAAYFAGLTDNTIAAGLPTADFAGQMLMTQSSTIGGAISGQLWFAGNDLSWRRDLQLGGIVIFQNNGAASDGLLVKTTNGIDNCITVQSQSSNHFSAIRFVDRFAQETGAIGYANNKTSIYPNMDYLESYGNNNGFYFVASGNTFGGLERTTGHFVWYAGTSTNDVTSTKVLDVSLAGVVTNASDIHVGGKIYANSTHAMTLSSGLTDPQNFDIAGSWTTSGNIAAGSLRTDSGISGVAGSTSAPALGVGFQGFIERNYNVYWADSAVGAAWMTFNPPTGSGGSHNAFGASLIITNGAGLGVGITGSSISTTNVFQVDTVGGSGAFIVATNGSAYIPRAIIANPPTFGTTNSAPGGFSAGTTSPRIWIPFTNGSTVYYMPGY